MSICKGRYGSIPIAALGFAQDLWEALDTPVSLSCYLHVKYGEFRQLVEKTVDPSVYLDPDSFYKDHQAVALLSKFPELNTGIDTAEVARRKFYDCEVRCRETNLRLRHPSKCDGVESVLLRAQRKIAAIVGDVPRPEALHYRFGPGASVGVRGKDTSAYKKIVSGLECSFDMVGTLECILAEMPGWFENDVANVTVRPGSALSFVPKNAKTDRPICIEPCLNGMVQVAIGEWLKTRLRRWGIDLYDQGTNQRLAGEAWERGLATVDFSSASDTISREVVASLFPLDWYLFLSSFRCSYTEDQTTGELLYLEKFSSMGNGFTFEVETIIFFAIAASCCEQLGIRWAVGENLTVYGDDVILPAEAFALFERVSDYLGFMVNREKSFATGCFFESCGHDFFQGVPVRPFYIRHWRVSDVFRITNAVHAMAHRLRSRRLFSLHHKLVQRIPRVYRVLVPEGFEDYGLVADFDVATPARETRFKWDLYRFVGYAYRAVSCSQPEWPTGYVLYLAYRSPMVDVLEEPRRRFRATSESGAYNLRGEARQYRGVFYTPVWPNTFMRWQSRTLRLIPRRDGAGTRGKARQSQARKRSV